MAGERRAGSFISSDAAQEQCLRYISSLGKIMPGRSLTANIAAVEYEPLKSQRLIECEFFCIVECVATD